MFSDSSHSVTTVTTTMMNTVLGNVLELIRTNIGTLDAPWMNRIASRWHLITNWTLNKPMAVLA